MGDENGQPAGAGGVESLRTGLGGAGIYKWTRPRHGERLSGAELLSSRRCFIVYPAHDDEFGGTAGWPVDADDPLSDDANGAALEWATSRYGATVGEWLVYCRVLDPDGVTETHVQVELSTMFDKALGQVLAYSGLAKEVEQREIPTVAGPWLRDVVPPAPPQPAASPKPSTVNPWSGTTNPWGKPNPRRGPLARSRRSEVPDVG
jgi:hypothetical protein